MVAKLIEGKYTDNTKMPFGIHRGKPLGDVPADYLLWIYDNMDLDRRLKEYIDRMRDALEMEVE